MNAMTNAAPGRDCAPSAVRAVAEHHGPRLLAASTDTPTIATISLMAVPGWWSQDLERFLISEGFAVVVDPSGDSAFDRRTRPGDVVIIDLASVDGSIATICAAWRRRTAAPILAVVGSRDESAVLGAFAAGADQVVTKDITSRQIVAHVRSLLRQVPPRRAPDAAADAGPVRLGPDGCSADVNSWMVPLTEEEFVVLELLLDRGGRVVTRAELASALSFSSGNRRAVDFFVRRLREKLEEVDTRRRVMVVRGVGFRFDADGALVDRLGPAEDPR